MGDRWSVMGRERRLRRSTSSLPAPDHLPPITLEYRHVPRRDRIPLQPSHLAGDE